MTLNKTYLFKVLYGETKMYNEKDSLINNISILEGYTGEIWYDIYTNRNRVYIEKKIIKLVELFDYNLELKNYDYLYGVMGYLYVVLLFKKKYNSNQFDYLFVKYYSELQKESTIYYYNPNIGKCSKGIINLGLSHGIQSQLKLLIELKNINYNTSSTLKYIEYLFCVLENSRNADGMIYSVIDNDEKYKSMLAWCYGDLTLCFFYIQLYQVTRNSKYIEIVQNTLNMYFMGDDLIKYIDIGNCYFCHGNSGIAYILNKIMLLLKDYKMSSLIHRFIDLAEKVHLNKTYHKEEFLDGDIGYKLALKSIEKKDFKWDSCIMLNFLDEKI